MKPLNLFLRLAISTGFKTELLTKFNGLLMRLVAFSMIFSVGIKSTFDYSVFSAAAAAFALSLMKEKYLELDNLFKKTNA